MNSRAHKSFIIKFFLDEGIVPELAEAARLVSEECAINTLAQHVESEEEKSESFPRLQDDQFKEQFRMKRSSFEVKRGKQIIRLLGNKFSCSFYCKLLVMPLLERNIISQLHKSRCQRSYSTR